MLVTLTLMAIIYLLALQDEVLPTLSKERNAGTVNTLDNDPSFSFLPETFRNIEYPKDLNDSECISANNNIFLQHLLANPVKFCNKYRFISASEDCEGGPGVGHLISTLHSMMIYGRFLDNMKNRLGLETVHLPVIHHCQQNLLCNKFRMPKNVFLMRAHVEKVCKPHVDIHFYKTDLGIFNDSITNFAEIVSLNLDPDPWMHIDRLFLQDTKDMYGAVLKINPDYLKAGLKMLKDIKYQSPIFNAFLRKQQNK